MKQHAIIFTDGSSRGNPGPGGWGAVVCHDDMVTELGGQEVPTTNNRMEITAALRALASLPAGFEAVVNTDSSYLINGITKWVFGWRKNNWMTSQKEEVLNRDLWEGLLDAVEGKKVVWNYVGGHVGIAGNERCDVIATEYADGMKPELFNGKKSDYTIDLDAISADSGAVQKKKSKSSKSGVKAYSYLSLIGGVLEKHSTWPECEARVKGKSGARFKKSVSADDEAAIMKEWGV